VNTKHLHQIQPRPVVRRSGEQRHWALVPSTIDPRWATESSSTLQPKTEGEHQCRDPGVFEQRADCPAVFPTEDRLHQARRRSPPTYRPVLQPRHVDLTLAPQADEPKPQCAQQQCRRSSKRRSVFRDKRYANLPHVEQQCVAHRLVSRSEPAWRLTMSLSGRLPPCPQRRGRTIAPSARGAYALTRHGRSKRWLDRC